MSTSSGNIEATLAEDGLNLTEPRVSPVPTTNTDAGEVVSSVDDAADPFLEALLSAAKTSSFSYQDTLLGFELVFGTEQDPTMASSSLGSASAASESEEALEANQRLCAEQTPEVYRQQQLAVAKVTYQQAEEVLNQIEAALTRFRQELDRLMPPALQASVRDATAADILQVNQYFLNMRDRYSDLAHALVVLEREEVPIDVVNQTAAAIIDLQQQLYTFAHQARRVIQRVRQQGELIIQQAREEAARVAAEAEVQARAEAAAEAAAALRAQGRVHARNELVQAKFQYETAWTDIDKLIRHGGVSRDRQEGFLRQLSSNQTALNGSHKDIAAYKNHAQTLSVLSGQVQQNALLHLFNQREMGMERRKHAEAIKITEGENGQVTYSTRHAVSNESLSTMIQPNANRGHQSFLAAGAKHLPSSAIAKLTVQALFAKGDRVVSVQVMPGPHDVRVKTMARIVLASVQAKLLPNIHANDLQAIKGFYLQKGQIGNQHWAEIQRGISHMCDNYINHPQQNSEHLVNFARRFREDCKPVFQSPAAVPSGKRNSR